jgi:3-oxoacyl-[acyl-carrier protein] reductase
METTAQQVVITGGGGTLAQAIAEAFAADGFAVDAPPRDRLDVSCPRSIDAYFRQSEPDLVVCNAGITRDAMLVKLSADDWDDVWRVNFIGAFRCAQAVLPTMRRRRTGHIVLISSHAAIRPFFGQSAYAASKAALHGVVSALASEHGSAGIRVNAVLPGFLETRMTAELSDDRRAQVLADHALGKFNTIDAAARFIRFLHAELAHTSGQIFQLDSRRGALDG